MAAYLDLRSGWLALEEFWVFLIETVYRRRCQGFFVFEDQHKMLFRQEVLENRYVEEFLKDVHRNYQYLEQCLATNAHTAPSVFSEATSAVLSDIGFKLLTLENEVNLCI